MTRPFRIFQRPFYVHMSPVDCGIVFAATAEDAAHEYSERHSWIRDSAIWAEPISWLRFVGIALWRLVTS